ncbi:MAG TPA: histidine kinase [Bacteroidetes bacterium]|nr:histidine kinase [Bacteroidota bacterium]
MLIHPILSKRNRLLVYWLIWLIIGLGQSLLISYSSGISVVAAFSDGFISALIFGMTAIALWFPANQFKQGIKNMKMTLINHLLMAVIALGIWVFLTKLLVLAFLQEGELYKSFWENSIYYRLGAGAFIYVVVILTYYLLISMDNIARKDMREAKLENMLKEAELMMLRSQINPHFLFNSLNSISSLTISDAPRAREMVIKLSDFMRYALSRKEDRTVKLQTELENLRLYLDIEKIRFGERLEFREDVSDECLKVKVPNMILQPLYENAIKHGVYESPDKVRIKLTARRLNGAISISISNDFDPETIAHGGTGTGLNNVRRRLELYYGNRAWLKTVKEAGLFTAEIYIPEHTDMENE